MALWRSKSSKQLDSIGQAILNSVGLCDSEILAWLKSGRINGEFNGEPALETAAIHCHFQFLLFFLYVASQSFSIKVSEKRSQDLFNELKKKVIIKGASMLPSSRSDQAYFADLFLKKIDPVMLEYRHAGNLYSDSSELDNLVLKLFQKLGQAFPGLAKDEPRILEFASAIFDVVNVSLSHTKLRELAEALE